MLVITLFSVGNALFSLLLSTHVSPSSRSFPLGVISLPIAFVLGPSEIVIMHAYDVLSHAPVAITNVHTM